MSTRININEANFGAKLLELDPAEQLRQNIPQLFFNPDELHCDLAFFCTLPDVMKLSIYVFAPIMVYGIFLLEKL